MATITPEALDAQERAKLGRRNPALDGRTSPRLAAPAGASNAIALAFIVGGAGTILAPAPLPFPADVLAIGAVALGGWLARGSGDPLELRATLARERAQLNRVLVALALRGVDVGPRAAQRPLDRAPEPERREDAGVHPGSGPGALHAVDDGLDGESLDASADAGAI